MSLITRKISAFAKKVADLADRPGGTIPTAELKAQFDSSPEELRVAHNGLVDDLASTITGSSGAEQIGSAPIVGLTGATPYAQITDLKTQLSNVALGEIPDNTVTPAKLTFDPVTSTEYTAADVLSKLLTVDGPTSGIDAETVGGWKFRYTSGVVEYNDGTGWKAVGNTVFVASNTIQEQDATTRNASVNNSSFLVYKFVPKGTGEVVVSFEMTATAGTSVMKMSSGGANRRHGGTLATAPSDVMPNLLSAIDYRTPLGTVTSLPSSNTTDAVDLVSAAITTFTAYSFTIKIFEQTPIYFLLANSGPATVQCRNFQIKYDRM